MATRTVCVDGGDDGVGLLRRCDGGGGQAMRRMAATRSGAGPLQRVHQLLWLLRCWVVAATSSGLALSLPRPAATTAGAAGL
jgi:hypothetical protein